MMARCTVGLELLDGLCHVDEVIRHTLRIGGEGEVLCADVGGTYARVQSGDVVVRHGVRHIVDGLLDLVGGVEVEVLHDFTGIDETLVKGQKVTLTGEQALLYVRTRYGLEENTNSARMERQQQYMNALYQLTQERIANDSNFVVDASLSLSDYIVSDRSVTQLQTLAEKFNRYEFLGIQSIAGESKAGAEFMEFYPDEDALMELVIRLFYQEVNP